MEDTWTSVSMYLYHSHGPPPPSHIGVEDSYQGTESIKLEVLVSYGNLDMYDTEPKCTYTTASPQVCIVDLLSIRENVPGDRPKYMEYTNFIDSQTDKKKLTIIGNYRQLILAMKTLKYK
jgi:hypothetical protein